MKKRVLIILMAMAFAFSLAGCGDETKDETSATKADETTTEATEETTLAAAQENEPTGNQIISMGNLEMQIPSKWEYSGDSNDREEIYVSADGSTEFSIEMIQKNDDQSEEGLAESAAEYLEEMGYEEIGYDDMTVGSGIEAKFTSVDKSLNPNGMYQQLVTMGKGATFYVLSCQQDNDDFTDFDRALDTITIK